MENFFSRNTLGVIGIIIALMGVGVAVFQDDIRAQFQTEPVEMRDRVFEKGAQLLGIEVEHKNGTDWVKIVQFALGFIGIVCGVISWVRKEDHRISSMAAALGIVAVAWEYVLIAVGIAVIFLIIGSFG